MNERQQLIDKAKEVAANLGCRRLARSDFIREAGVPESRIRQHFDGWLELCELAGLETNTQNVRLDDDEIFVAMRDAFVQMGRIGPMHKFNRVFRFSVDIFKRRGMRWNDALLAFRQWCEKNDPNFYLLAELPVAAETRALASLPPDFNVDTSSKVSTWARVNGRVYGEFLNFRGLQHAPVNEQGVVFLFGMVAHELGYTVESVQTGYPDCEAKRKISPNRWERIRIEFEFTSRSFRDHGHDPKGCDVIVCWEHNYPACPVEVLALGDAIKKLPGYDPNRQSPAR